MIDPTLADALRSPPLGSPVMRQDWINLTFIHFPVDPEVIQLSLPPGLTVDVFPDANGVEKAWVGLVPFEICNLALSNGLRIPTTIRFLETNVRTYVHRDGQDPGVWFYSLDAQSRLACLAARTWYGLPYWVAEMTYEESGDRRLYQGQRAATPRPSYQVDVDVGPELPESQPGCLEFFLVERYLLYSYYRRRLRTGRVHHGPYPLREAKLPDLGGQLISVLGFQVEQPASVLFSPDVVVNVFPLR